VAAGERPDVKLGGPISWMAQNPVAANLLMFVIFVGGCMGLMRTKQEVFPEFSLDLVTVAVPYPGASPEEVEQGIVLAVEEAVRGLDGVKRVTSTSSEGVGTVLIETLLDADPEKVLADTKSAVDRISSFPEDAEDPAIALAANRQVVVTLLLSGEHDMHTLHALAEQARADLLDSPEITLVEISGLPALEVSIDVTRQTLESLGLTLDDIARQIRASSLELPGGAVESESGELLVRLSDRRVDGVELADVIIRGTRGGAALTLGEIATIRDGFEDTDQASFYNGAPAVRVTAYRVGDETPSGVAAAVRAHAEALEATLPETVDVAIWDDDSEVLRARIDLLVRNATLGLVLVLCILALFLELRLAFWVALGIPISFMGAFLVMPGIGLSINMITLFALIVTLGMVVDDAIVVGENAFSKMSEGVSAKVAAITGAREMAVPVTFAILTTIAAFSPMFFVPGVMGKIFRLFPSVVIAVLVFSLLESFFILPAHLAHVSRQKKGRLLAAADRPRQAATAWLKRFIQETYGPLLDRALQWRYVTVAAAVALFFLSVGMVGGGVVPFSFFPKLQGDMVSASARLPYGVPLERTLEVREALEASLAEAVAGLEEQGLVNAQLTRVGEGLAGSGFDGLEISGNLVTVDVELVPSGEREVTAAGFAAAWKAATPPLPGVEALLITSAFGPGAGAAVDVQLSHRDTDVLAQASYDLTEQLRSFTDLTDVENGYAAGKPQLDYHLLPAATTLGLTGEQVARQIRAAFYGAEALREQRGRNEVKVMVRLPENQRRSEYDLEQLRIRTPRGGDAPLASVASFERGRAPTSIRREAGRRVVNVKAELAPGVRSSNDVLGAVTSETLPSLAAKYPGLTAELAGEQREQAESFAALGQNYILALFAIFALLAVPFKSYTQPLIIMSAIPFGFVGAVGGHLLMGYELSLISMFGIIALSGVVVNDSLVLIDAANRARRAGATPLESIRFAAKRRLRPIMLTSLTTFFGLMPMIFETSVQARFLIPMAISLGFGVLFATVIVLVVVPSLYMVLDDVDALARRLLDRSGAARTEPRSAAGK